MAPRSRTARPWVAALILAILVVVAVTLRQATTDAPVPVERAETAAVPTEAEGPRIEDPVLRSEVPAVDASEDLESLRGRTIDLVAGTPRGVKISLSQEVPAFVRMDPIAGEAQNSTAPERSRVVSATFDETGTFVLRGERLVGYLVPADPFLVARDAVYADAREAATTADLKFEPAGVVRGTVRGPDGVAVGDAEVVVKSRVGMDVAFSRTPIRKTATTRTGADGSFLFEQVPADVDFDLSIDAPGLIRQWSSVRVASGETKTMAIDLGAGVALSGRVRLANGSPVGGAEVHVTEAIMRVDPQAPQRADVGTLRAISGEDGRFVVRGLLPGRYVASATHGDYVRASLSAFEVPAAGLELQNDIVLIEGPRIRGRVVDDAGIAVAGAEIALRATSPFMMNGMGLTPDSAEQMGGRRFSNGEDGAFESPPLDDGEYDLIAVKDGYTQAFAPSVRAGASGVDLVLGQRGAIEGTVIALDSASPVITFHVAALRPFDFSKLTDPATFEPVKHAVVLSAKGRYRLADLSAGEYNVSVTAEGLARTTVDRVVVKAGETTRAVNFFLRPESVIAGTITEAGTSKAVAGARVTTRQGLDAMQPDPLAADSEAQSDATGRFELRGLAAGRYTLSATAPRLAPASVGPIELSESQRRDDVSIVLARGAILRGRVTDAKSLPIPGAMITATRIGSISPGITVADVDGYYRLEGLPAGSYTVTKLSALSLGSKDATSDMLRGMQTKSAQLENGKELVLDFQDGADGSVRLSGLVTIDGQPAGNVLLHFMSDDAEEDDKETGGLAALDADVTAGEAFHIATSDPNGRYEIDSLKPGAWSVTVQTRMDLSSAARKTFDLELGPAADQVHDFAISRTGIEGIVVRRGDRSPIAGARVSIDALNDDARLDPVSRRLGMRRVAELFADAEGRFRSSGLEPGRYRIVAGGLTMMNLGGGNFARSAPKDFTLTEGQVIDGVEFELEPGASIQGTILAAGSGAEGASLFFIRNDGGESNSEPFSSTITNAAGAYVADGLEPGTYTVAVKARGYAPAWQSHVRVNQNETTTVDLVVVEGTPLQVTILDAEGNDITASCVIRVHTPDGLDLSDLRSINDLVDAALRNGSNSTMRLPSGNYELVVNRGEASKKFVISHGATSTHRLTFDA